MNLPNKLTMGRIFAIPVFIVVFLMDYRIAAAVIFILAAVTDMLDGHIARKHNLVTNFGKLMDPLADKLLVMSALICMVEVGDVAGWMVVVILGREFIITGMRQVAAAQGIVIAAGTTGKIKTITQMIAIPLLILENWPFTALGIPVPFDQIFLWIALIMTIVSGAEYIMKNKQLFSM
ncbi:MAG: CDP-diacylglycerol--glycerol-3-phosphate 3-phosphatidyltransferase [Bacillota bacterium]|nr:CDP-diacylglycerol--glycerol-3-phosphate 3-phosphatidyltransferase [Bacillota bacterium]MBR1993240.1 CDP-diacylglycerol--glycerol-3-phosphate 3-phosphatidyltransferase [Bacillota bacterium]MBR3787061.1 CDP-diacylglycerol--glycerol-3-phosphate 3-phosphatidyltransferase [Bacillota bacterium]MBR6798725.1 CDP-diacylglycerol--glycerol-3-phosphate 3-phosphatidyltransferase [Bacillota bacterium]MDO5414970.1 CDP-diacylglycerol--glycerol-3-phosphate 3-phosphatidyltransferase [Bacillota bacterium]